MGGRWSEKRRHADTADRTAGLSARGQGAAIRAAWLTWRHLAASLGAACGVCFPSFEDGTLGMPSGSTGWRVGMADSAKVRASARTPISLLFPLLARAGKRAASPPSPCGLWRDKSAASHVASGHTISSRADVTRRSPERQP